MLQARYWQVTANETNETILTRTDEAMKVILAQPLARFSRSMTES